MSDSSSPHRVTCCRGSLAVALHYSGILSWQFAFCSTDWHRGVRAGVLSLTVAPADAALNTSPARCVRPKRTGIPPLSRTGHVVRAGSPAVAKRSRFDWLFSLQSSLPSGADWLRDEPRLHSRIFFFYFVHFVLQQRTRQESRLAFCGQCFSCSTQVRVSSFIPFSRSLLDVGCFFVFFFSPHTDYLCCCGLRCITGRQLPHELCGVLPHFDL